MQEADDVEIERINIYINAVTQALSESAGKGLQAESLKELWANIRRSNEGKPAGCRF